MAGPRIAPGTKVSEVLKFKDRGLTVEEAKKAMIEAGEAPRGIAPARVAPAPILEPTTLESADPVVAAAEVFDEEMEVTTAPVVAPVTPVAPVAPMAPVAPTPLETVETDQFVGKIYQENGKWVAELQYKNGAGTERFVATNKNALMLDLLKGKGHATMRVKEAVRREKLGGPVFDRSYALPEGITSEDFTALPEKQQDLIIYTIASQQSLLFRDTHPEYLATVENSKRIDEFLSKNNLPVTLKNLAYAFEDLSESGLLELRAASAPSAVVTTLSVPAPAPVRTDSVPAVAAPVTVLTVTPAPVTPTVVVRKRGTSGLRPTQSSSPSEPERVEDGGGPKELTEAELRKLSPIGKPVTRELRDRAYAERIANAQRR